MQFAIQEEQFQYKKNNFFWSNLGVKNKILNEMV